MAITHLTDNLAHLRAVLAWLVPAARLTRRARCRAELRRGDGGEQTARVAGPVVMGPKCLAMCGVLFGKPDDIEFGDVIFADPLCLLHDSSSGGRKTVKILAHGPRDGCRV